MTRADDGHVEPIRFHVGRPFLLAGLRRRHPFAAAPQGIARQWRDFLESEVPPGAVEGARYGVMCGSDASSVEFMCGVEVASLETVPAGVGRMRVPAQRYAVFSHRGGPGALGAAWLGILSWLDEGPYASAHRPDFEVYPPGVDPRAHGDGVEIWVGVVERNGTDPG